VSPVTTFRTVLASRVILHVVPAILGVTASRMGSIRPLPSPEAHLVADVIFYAVALSVFVGLWFFHRWARITYLTIIALFVLVCLARPQPAFASTTFLGFFMLQSLLDGFIIALSYLGPVRERFTKKA
jgi:hypothetical protein